MRKKLPVILPLSLAAAGVAAYGRLPWRQWWQGLAQWAEAHQGLISLVGVFVGVVAAVAVAHWQRRWQQGASKDDPGRLALEHNYLKQLVDKFYEDLWKHPLSPDEESEILELQAELHVEPKFRVFDDETARRDPAAGETTSDLVSTLLKSDVPVVVLGEPGAGKSVALRKVMLTLAHEGQRHPAPRLPVYVRLGFYTQAVTGEKEEAIGFIRESLRAMGGHAARIEADFDRYRDEGRLVFLLDSMDEMPRDHLQKRLETLARLRSYTPNKILFACRKLDFRETFPFLRAEIKPFDRGQIKDFLRRTLGDLGRAAAWEVLSPSYPLRNMASNPFFLKLLSEFYRTKKRLPDSRAELLTAYEEQVFNRARERKRETFPAGVTPEDFRAVLARLAYLTTTSRRGVTLPLGDFLAGFVSGRPGVEARLCALEGKARLVFDLAVEERMLRTDDGRPPGEPAAEKPLAEFYHHRLLEYYTAVYLEEFGSEFDWEESLDDIWWQEILVMLFGITKRPDERMVAFLEHLPERPVLCPQLGDALGEVISRTSYSSYDFNALDPSDFYGLKGVAEEAGGDGDLLLSKLAGLGLLDPATKRTEALAAEFRDLSAEPDDNADRERARRWLEERNTPLLDRLALACECYRNALTRIGQGPAARAARERLVAALSAFSRDGNMWETVRAIQTASMLPGVELTEVVDPVLTHKDAWCRREAMSSVAKYPFDTAGGRGLVGFILFIQFMQGELFSSLPQFARAAWEKPRLALYAPGVLLLTLLSLAAVLSPLGLYPLFAHAAGWTAHDPQGLFGLSNATLSMCVLCAAPVYFAKLIWGLPVLRLTLLVAAVIFAAPKAAPHLLGDGGSRTAAAAGQERAAGQAGEDKEEGEPPQEGRLSAVLSVLIAAAYGAAVLIFPQLAELAGLAVVALVSSPLLGSRRILRTPSLYAGDLNAFKTPLDEAQWNGGFGLSWALALWLGSHLLSVLVDLFPFLNYVPAVVGWVLLLVFLAAAAVGLSQGVVRGVKRLNRSDLSLDWWRVRHWAGRRGVSRGRLLAAVAVVACVVAVGYFSGALAGLDFAGARLADFVNSESLSMLAGMVFFAVTSFYLFRYLFRSWRRLYRNVLVPFYKSVADFVAVILRRPLRFMGAAPRRHPLALGRDMRDSEIFKLLSDADWQSGLSPGERFHLYREALSYAKSRLLRVWIYRERAKLYKEVRQDKGRGGVRDRIGGADGEL